MITIKYHFGFNETRKFHELQETNLKNSVKGENIDPIFKNLNYEIKSTSLNRFSNFKDYNEIIDKEKEWYDYGKKQLGNNLYFPGFFIIFAKKI